MHLSLPGSHSQEVSERPALSPRPNRDCDDCAGSSVVTANKPLDFGLVTPGAWTIAHW
jgi:hypothetical protein